MSTFFNSKFKNPFNKYFFIFIFIIIIPLAISVLFLNDKIFYNYFFNKKIYYNNYNKIF